MDRGDRDDGTLATISTDELAARLPLHPKTIPGLVEKGEIPGQRIGHGYRFIWATVYETIAGPGVPDGEVVGLGELARRLGVSEKVLRRAYASEEIPGRKVGKKYMFAVEAVRQRLRGGERAAAGQAGGAPRG